MIADSNVALTGEVISDLIKICNYKVHIRLSLMCQAEFGICKKNVMGWILVQGSW